jgi:hypothetical protein
MPLNFLSSAWPWARGCRTGEFANFGISRTVPASVPNHLSNRKINGVILAVLDGWRDLRELLAERLLRSKLLRH